MSARISKTQASRNKLQGLIREAEILKAQHLKALTAIRSDQEYMALELQIQRQERLIRSLRGELVLAQDGAIDTNKLFAERSRQQIAQRDEAIRQRNNMDIEVQNLREKVRRRDGKLFDYRVLTILMAVGSAVHLGVKYIPGLF